MNITAWLLRRNWLGVVIETKAYGGVLPGRESVVVVSSDESTIPNLSSIGQVTIKVFIIIYWTLKTTAIR